MHENFVFADFRELFAKANEEKSGDQLAGIAVAEGHVPVFVTGDFEPDLPHS